MPRHSEDRTTLREAEVLLQNKLFHGCISRLYYAAFHITAAWLFYRGIQVKSHRGHIKEFNRLSLTDDFITKQDKLLLQMLHDSRQESDYGDFVILNDAEVLELYQQTSAIVNRYKQALAVI